MSNYGLRIRNTKKEFQIDGSWPNYVLSQIVKGQSGGSFNFLSNTRFPPIVAVRPVNADDGGTLGDLNYTAPNYTGFKAGGNNFDYAVFLTDIAKHSGIYGLRVKNNKGELVFESNDVTLRIRDFISTSVGSTESHPTVENPYYLMTPLQYRIICPANPPAVPSAPITLLGSAIKKVSSTSFTSIWAGLANLGTGGSYIDENTGTGFNVVICEIIK